MKLEIALNEAMWEERQCQCKHRTAWFFLLQKGKNNGISGPGICRTERKKLGQCYDELSCWLDFVGCIDGDETDEDS